MQIASSYYKPGIRWHHNRHKAWRFSITQIVMSLILVIQCPVWCQPTLTEIVTRPSTLLFFCFRPKGQQGVHPLESCAACLPSLTSCWESFLLYDLHVHRLDKLDFLVCCDSFCRNLAISSLFPLLSLQKNSICVFCSIKNIFIT